MKNSEWPTNSVRTETDETEYVIMTYFYDKKDEFVGATIEPKPGVVEVWCDECCYNDYMFEVDYKKMTSCPRCDTPKKLNIE